MKLSPWVKIYEWVKNPKGPCPPKLMNLAKGRAEKSLTRAINRGRPAGKPPDLAAKKRKSLRDRLYVQLEDACKAVVKKRDLGYNNLGACISCRKLSYSLQWGHFIPQHTSIWLRWDPRASAMQCVTCNGFLGGNYAAYAKELDTKYGAGFSDGLTLEAKRHHAFKPSLKWLEDKLARLRQMLQDPEIKFHDEKEMG